MVNVAKCVAKVNICDEYVILHEYDILQYCQYSLYLMKDVALGFESFIIFVEYFMGFTEG